MLLYDGAGINTMAVRLFILERGHVSLDVKQIDIMNMENRKPAFVKNFHSRGTSRALRISDDFVLTEITAIAEYVDEVANGGESLFGTTALERAETRMWLRRADLEIYRTRAQHHGLKWIIRSEFLCQLRFAFVNSQYRPLKFLEVETILCSQCPTI
ncbi:hypothetical protein CEP54_006762 [Fusarium duplospermum]|uniref:Uncharacterized protein n=1 Tax=Fusarium duplospermum TaxID=1325734 RepID=A0A428Q5D0_9HYPO|nr:hypothetical protein CEP54_006762 [Fusarium duplospermum]